LLFIVCLAQYLSLVMSELICGGNLFNSISRHDEISAET